MIRKHGLSQVIEKKESMTVCDRCECRSQSYVAHNLSISAQAEIDCVWQTEILLWLSSSQTIMQFVLDTDLVAQEFVAFLVEAKDVQFIGFSEGAGADDETWSIMLLLVSGFPRG